jgi:hypothetical protein
MRSNRRRRSLLPISGKVSEYCAVTDPESGSNKNAGGAGTSTGTVASAFPHRYHFMEYYFILC